MKFNLNLSRLSFFSALFILLIVIVSTYQISDDEREVRSPFFPVLRRLDCDVFCKTTGFSGFIGGCQCGFTLFAKRSGQQQQGARLFK